MSKPDVHYAGVYPTNKKPPLGLRPKSIWKNSRVTEVDSAIKRYEDAGVDVPKEWIDELESLIKE